MYNDFVLIGPKSDPAGIKGMKDVAEALQTIKEKQAPFISRGDRSGTHIAELALWNKDAGIDIETEKGRLVQVDRPGHGRGAQHRAAPAMPMCCRIAAPGLSFKNKGDLPSSWKATSGCSTSTA